MHRKHQRRGVAALLPLLAFVMNACGPSDASSPEEATATAERPLNGHFVGAQTDRWNDTSRRNLTYCVSKAFKYNATGASRYADMVNAMNTATADWERATGVDFHHVQSADDTCVAGTGAVTFAVTPEVFQGGTGAVELGMADPNAYRGCDLPYLGKSSWPSDPVHYVSIPNQYWCYFYTYTVDRMSLSSLLRHELGHLLGFTHAWNSDEYNAQMPGFNPRCEKDPAYTTGSLYGGYDRYSVMNNPNCDTYAPKQLTLSTSDGSGARRVYGPPIVPLAPWGVVNLVSTSIAGWALDLNTPGQELPIHVYFDGPLGHPDADGPYIVTTTGYRGDVNQTYDVAGNHGFSVAIPEYLQNGEQHMAYIYAADSATGALTNIGAKAFTLGSSGLDPCDAKPWLCDY